MGRKKYYCDFCNRYFNDDKNTRMKHLNSLGHINLKKEHYNMFRDPETVLIEESGKKPCKKFHFDGYCQFGGSCTFSHYTKEDLNEIRKELYENKRKKKLAELTVDSWLQKYYQNLDVKKQKLTKLLWSCELPPELLMNSAFLPQSMLPYHVKDFLDSNLESWG